jgi:hypothetical protein
MKAESRKSSCVLLTAFFAIVASETAVAQPSSQPGVGFAIVGIAAGQTASVDVVNLAQLNPSTRTPPGCGVTLQFLDDHGRSVKQTIATLQPGKAVSLDLRRDELPGNNLRVRFRAVVLFGQSGGAPPGPGSQQVLSCNSIVPSLQIYDTATGRTNFMLTNVTRLPSPATPAQ